MFRLTRQRDDDAPFAVTSGEGGVVMPEGLKLRFRGLARRAGLGGVPDSVLLVALVGCVALIAFGAWRWWPRDGVTVGASSHPPSAALVSAQATSDGGAVTTSSTASNGATVWVHVVGAVRRPGVYELPKASRLVNALDAAGGLLGNAASEAVNLARPLEDGEQILVPTKDEWAKAGTALPGAGPGSSMSGGSPSKAGPVDLNTADAALLDTLPGVGPSTAAKIVADREANGPFASVDDLGRVSGIGPKKLDALKDLVCVR